MAPLIYIVFAVLIVGVIVWGIDQIPAIDPTFKQLARVVLIVVLVIFVLVTLFQFLAGEFPSLGWPRRG